MNSSIRQRSVCRLTCSRGQRQDDHVSTTCTSTLTRRARDTSTQQGFALLALMLMSNQRGADGLVPSMGIRSASSARHRGAFCATRDVPRLAGGRRRNTGKNPRFLSMRSTLSRPGREITDSPATGTSGVREMSAQMSQVCGVWCVCVFVCVWLRIACLLKRSGVCPNRVDRTIQQYCLLVSTLLNVTNEEEIMCQYRAAVFPSMMYS